jgi:CRP-like cAMP-binding protein
MVPDNRLLSSLPLETQKRLSAHLHSVRLDRSEVLFRANEAQDVVYFPTTAVVSLVGRLESGETLEVGLVGRDGLAGTGIFPGVAVMSCDGIVQIPGLAWRTSADVFRRELLADESLHAITDRFAQVLLMRSMQLSVCNMFHSVEQRCIRWLLAVHDNVGDDDIPVTHELLATMLGVHRPTITLAIRAIDRNGLIEERRGHVRIRDRQQLESACCECYGLMREQQRSMLGY